MRKTQYITAINEENVMQSEKNNTHVIHYRLKRERKKTNYIMLHKNMKLQNTTQNRKRKNAIHHTARRDKERNIL